MWMSIMQVSVFDYNTGVQYDFDNNGWMAVHCPGSLQDLDPFDIIPFG
jgi:hypothetical protein